MTWTDVSSEVTQYKIKLCTDGGDRFPVTLTQDNGGWNLTVPEKTVLTIKELMDICELIYSKHIVHGMAVIVVKIKNSETVYVRGENNISIAFLSTIKVELS